MPSFFSHSFHGVTAPARYGLGAGPWTRLLLEQSPLGPVGFVQIDDQPLPEDLTPETPEPLDVTTEAATLPEGLFRFRFADADGILSPYTEAVRSPAPAHHADLPEWTPTPDDVAVHILVRTRDDETGLERGGFGADTRPTLNEVNRLIALACTEVQSYLRRPVPEHLHAEASRLTAVRAAALIETSRFPDEDVERESTRGRLDALFLDGIRRLYDRMQSNTGRFLA